MTHLRTSITCVVLLLLIANDGRAQWLKYPTPGTPRTKDGRPNLSGPAPRTADGKPDLFGVWMHDLTPVDELKRLFGPAFDEIDKTTGIGMEGRVLQKYALNLLADMKSEDALALLRPDAAAIMQRRASEPPQDGCGPKDALINLGFLIPGLLAEPIKIVQAPRLTLVLYEVGNSHRQIYTDGRTLPHEYNLPAYLGYSVGRWDRDTFVVETAGFNDKTLFDLLGHPHSDRMHVVERFRRRDVGHLDVELTFDDPKMYTRPFTINITYHLLADGDIFEMFDENEKDCSHIRTR